MIYEFYNHPEKKIKVIVYPNGNCGDNKRRFTIQRCDNDLIKKPMGSRRDCREYLEKKGYVRDPEVTRTSNKNYSGGI
jgi:hypothetical protein